MSIIENAIGEAEECPYAPAVVRAADLADEWAKDSSEHHARGAHDTADILFFCAADLKRALEGVEE